MEVFLNMAKKNSASSIGVFVSWNCIWGCLDNNIDPLRIFHSVSGGLIFISL